MSSNNLILISILSIILFSWVGSTNDTFVPTKEWQPIKEGQAIPRNLHVKIDLKTGEKYAKLMDDENTAVASVPSSESPTEAGSESANKSGLGKTINAELEQALKNIPADVLEYSPEKLEEIKAKYKTYDEIKKDLGELNVNIQTDSEILKDLFGKFANLTKDDKLDEKALFPIFEDLNYLVHQMDNALIFIDEGGLDKIILPMIVNQTSIQIRIKTLRLLGALTNNNPKAQIKVFEKNFGSFLSQILITSMNNEELSSALYSFGSLIRRFPHAQKEILSRQGTAALIAVLEKSTEIKVKTKAMILISDLIVEREEALNMHLDSSNEEKHLQYFQLNFEKWLLEGKFCNIVNEFFQESRNDIIRESDIVENLVLAFQTTHTMCFDVWSQSPLFRHTLLTIMNRFQESNEDFMIEIGNQIDDLYEKLFGHIKVKDEL